MVVKRLGLVLLELSMLTEKFISWTIPFLLWTLMFASKSLRMSTLVS